MNSNFQKFCEYAGRNLALWSPIIGNKFVHSSESIGECVIRDVRKAKNSQAIILYLDQLHSDRQNIPIDADFIYQQPSICLDFEIPKELIYTVEEVTSNKAEKSKHRGGRKSREEFQREIKRSLDPTFYDISETPELSEDDIRLAWIWRDNLRNADIKEMLEKPLPKLEDSKDYHWGRMLSARAAEKAIFSFFQNTSYKNVEDISISQLYGNEGLWQICDLRVDNMLIDVKNARSTRSSRGYVEFCVPAYKHDKRSDRNVWIAGALSKYLWPSTLASITRKIEATEILFMGLTKHEWIQELSCRFSIPDNFSIDFSRHNDSYNYLPPWAFSYPDRFYSLRDNILENLFSDFQMSEVIELTSPSPLPYFLAKGTNPFENNSIKPKTEWEKTFAELITSWTHELEYRHSLPFLFCSIFHHFIQMVIAASNSQDIEDFTPDKYRKFLYVLGLSKYPLLIYDPLWTISGLIDMLDQLWRTNRRLLADYKIYKLKNALILKGYKDQHSDPQTLIAYCGGRLPDHSHCGRYPLVIGQDEICSECGHLICSQCHFCSRKCYPDGHGSEK